MNSTKLLKLLGKKIRAIRKSKKISQEKLAELSGLHPTYISNIEQGKVNASIYSFYKISNALNIPFAELVRLQEGDAAKETENDITVLFGQLRKLDVKKQLVFISAARGLLSGIEKT